MLFRFHEELALFQTVKRCPLAAQPPARDCEACSSCRFNAAWAGQAEPGCHVDVPVQVWNSAMDKLRAKSAALHTSVNELRRRGPTVESADVPQWETLAAAFNQLGDAASREVASTIHLFIQTSKRTQRAVRLAE